MALVSSILFHAEEFLGDIDDILPYLASKTLPGGGETLA